MRAATVRAWCWVHKWASLVCTLFLLMLCLTGVPLIFHDEIDAAFDDRSPLAALPEDAPTLPLDAFVRTAMAMYPGERPLFMSFDNDRPVTNVTTGKVAQPGRGDLHITAIDRRTAKPVGALDEDAGIMAVILRLHVDMFAGLPGNLFLDFMGLLFCASIVSGIVVYAPFMRKLAFGEAAHAVAAASAGSTSTICLALALPGKRQRRV
ncbi:PepSY domain-containing protein [Sphingomonas sp. PL-96]|uniref:PepSY-associated TM helix domain-containing protein n=1 Tax=Sphingomonas sp. PL-96 TaxID=2887201 RepID=UPI001E5F55BB|nr:PepSY domain-containing protein [Sphingomonas sp. PL-96]MCC2975927.1 PepSY domain-containing protein [Sphingomonas sp. PL-96]